MSRRFVFRSQCVCVCVSVEEKDLLLHITGQGERCLRAPWGEERERKERSPPISWHGAQIISPDVWRWWHAFRGGELFMRSYKFVVKSIETLTTQDSEEE